MHLVILLPGPGHLLSPWGGMVLHFGQGHSDAQSSGRRNCLSRLSWRLHLRSHHEQTSTRSLGLKATQKQRPRTGRNLLLLLLLQLLKLLLCCCCVVLLCCSIVNYSKRIMIGRGADLSDNLSSIFFGKNVCFVSRPIDIATFHRKTATSQNWFLIFLMKNTHSEKQRWKLSRISQKKVTTTTTSFASRLWAHSSNRARVSMCAVL